MHPSEVLMRPDEIKEFVEHRFFQRIVLASDIRKWDVPLLSYLVDRK